LTKPQKNDRRSFLKYAGAAAAGLVVGAAAGYGAGMSQPAPGGVTQTVTQTQTVGGGVAALPKIPALPIGEKNPFVDFSGVEVSMIKDAGCGYYEDWCAPWLQKECGIKFLTDKFERIDFSKLLDKELPDLISGGAPTWNLMQICGLFFGDVVATGQLEPLDKYIAKFYGWSEASPDIYSHNEFWDQLMPVFRTFNHKFKGTTYAIQYDGDIHEFHYRKDLFENEDNKKKFQAETGKPLAPPETWDDVLTLAKFWKKNAPGNMWPYIIWTAPPFGWGYYFDFAAPLGVKYFDEGMNNALVPHDKAVQAAAFEESLVDYCPPGVENFSTETIDYWIQGRIVMQDWWFDIGEWGQTSTSPILGKALDSLLPGWKDPATGKIVRRSESLYNRSWVIPKNQPDKVKEALAYAILRLQSFPYSIYSETDYSTGMDPYLYLHFTDIVARQMTKPNPIRGVTKEYPDNIGLFPPSVWGSEEVAYEYARAHLAAGFQNTAFAFPQINWPGTSKYADSLTRHIQDVLAHKAKPEEAVTAAAAEFESIRDELGADKQRDFYADFVEKARSLGLW
jgi:ABC-type glycerol-3-phosphate transport system substrate-binding protein